MMAGGWKLPLLTLIPLKSSISSVSLCFWYWKPCEKLFEDPMEFLFLLIIKPPPRISPQAANPMAILPPTPPPPPPPPSLVFSPFPSSEGSTSGVGLGGFVGNTLSSSVSSAQPVLYSDQKSQLFFVISPPQSSLRKEGKAPASPHPPSMKLHCLLGQ